MARVKEKEKKVSWHEKEVTPDTPGIKYPDKLLATLRGGKLTFKDAVINTFRQLHDIGKVAKELGFDSTEHLDKTLKQFDRSFGIIELEQMM